MSNSDLSTQQTPMDVEEIEKTIEKTIEQQAEEKKTEGNACYAKKDYDAALRLYSEAIALCPKCAAYYGNRAATYMMLSKYDKALEDARVSTSIDPSFVKGYQREAKCHLAMGETKTAILLYDKVLQLEPNNAAAKSESNQAKVVDQHIQKATACFEKHDYRTVLYHMEKCIEISTACKKFQLLKAECLALLKRYQEAQEIANDILRQDGVCADAIYVRGLCLYYQDNIEKAFQHFKQVLVYAPDHSKARDVHRKAKVLAQKKEEGNAAFKAGQVQQAYDLYTEALTIDPLNVFTNSKLYYNRALVVSKLGKNEQAIEDCTKAIELDSSYAKAYMKRAKCYQDAEQFEEAVRDLEKVVKMDKTNHEYKKLLSEAKLALKKSKRKDYYKMLGLEQSATEDEIKKAYKKHALKHHPDRHSSASEEVQKAEEKKFKEIGEAYAVLSDPKKKARYDSGQDLDDTEGFGGGDFDPNIIFQSFFGGGGPAGFGFQQSHGFPGGFSFSFG